MNRDNASKETEADGRMMTDEGWQKTRDPSLCPSSGLPCHRANASTLLLWLCASHGIKMDKHIKDSSTCHGKKKPSWVYVSARESASDECPLLFNTAATKTQRLHKYQG